MTAHSPSRFKVTENCLIPSGVMNKLMLNFVKLGFKGEQYETEKKRYIVCTFYKRMLKSCSCRVLLKQKALVDRLF